MQNQRNDKVTCMNCGQQELEKFMAHVGHNAWKCMKCLFCNNNKTEKEIR